MTHVLSSCPPRLARYLSLGEIARACTLTLCREKRAYIVLFSKSHTIISALNPMYVRCPEARKVPEVEHVKQEMLLEWPERNVCWLVESSLMITLQPREYTTCLPSGWQIKPPGMLPEV